MPRSRVIFALVFAATWIAALLHVGLEANGLIPDHEHRAALAHSHESGPQQDEVGESEHQLIFARSGLQEGRLTAWIWLPCVLIVGLLMWLGLGLRGQVSELRPPPGWREALAISSWQFARRCASFTTAPPALS